MEMLQGAFISVEELPFRPNTLECCCDECGGLCRDMFDIMTVSEKRSFIAATRKIAFRKMPTPIASLC